MNALDARVRGWLWQQQGLDGSLVGASPAQALEVGGWARSVGGAGPYLSLFGRTGHGRAAIDAAAAALQIHELPSARGCTYVLPARDFALGLRASQGHADDAAIAQGRKHCGVTDVELDRLCEAILGALAAGPAEPDALKARCGDAVRHLGEVGKRVGLTTTLALGLGRLQTRGLIRRVPASGRLDIQRYAYTLWPDCPLASAPALTDAEVSVGLARLFFGWGAPATTAQFAAFGGLGARAARIAATELDLVPIEVGDERLILRDELKAFRAHVAAPEPQVLLLSSLDAITALRRDVLTLTGEVARGAQVLAEKSLAGSQGGSLADLPNHGLFDRGELIGLWDFDPEAGELVHMTFERPSGALAEQVEAAVARTLAFVRDELGDARSFSLDGPKSRAPRLQALRDAAKATR